MIRQTAANRSRSALNSGDWTFTVCVRVSVNGMPAWRRLLQALILPQKESRRRSIFIWPATSSSAWMRIGTLRPLRLIVSAMPRSSPKFGSVTMMPSIWPAFDANSSAHFFASSKVSTAPYFVSVIDSATAP